LHANVWLECRANGLAGLLVWKEYQLACKIFCSFTRLSGLLPCGPQGVHLVDRIERDVGPINILFNTTSLRQLDGRAVL